MCRSPFELKFIERRLGKIICICMNISQGARVEEIIKSCQLATDSPSIKVMGSKISV